MLARRAGFQSLISPPKRNATGMWFFLAHRSLSSGSIVSHWYVVWLLRSDQIPIQYNQARSYGKQTRGHHGS